MITSVLILTILIITLTLVLVSVSIYAIVTSGNNNNTTVQNCNQIVNTANLIQLPNDSNCSQQGKATPLYYIGDINSDYDYVVAPWTTTPLNVCISYCETYNNGTCTGTVSAGKTAQENFDNCMSQLNITSCIPPVPLAAKGTILYYAYSPTCNICDNCE